MNNKHEKFLNIQLDGKGKIYLQVDYPQSRWRFYLTDGESVWDGGFGLAEAFELVPTKRTTKKIEETKTAIENNHLLPDFRWYRFVNLAS